MATASQILSAQQFAEWCGIEGIPQSGRMNAFTDRWVRQFQHAYQYGDYARRPLTVDGDPGPKTMDAMRESFYADLACSENFGWKEFLTTGSKRVTQANHVLRVSRSQLAALQRLRDLKGRPLYMVSTYRDPHRNRQVGGAKYSQHMDGEAADLDRTRNGYEISEAEAVESGFDGIGMESRTNPHVAHVDTRGYRARWYYL